MSSLDPRINYLENVLGLKNVVGPLNSLLSKSQATTVALAFFIPKDASREAKGLARKISELSPLRPWILVEVDLNLGKNELERLFKMHTPRKALLFGESLFQLARVDDKAFYDYINESFKWANAEIYASHDLEDMCHGKNVKILKREVWQQLKSL